MTPRLIVGLCVVAIAVLIVVLPRLDTSSPLAAVVRLLVPSWRFFDAVSAPPELCVRVAGPDGRFDGWRPLLPPPRRQWWTAGWHPHGNLSFATHSLLFRLRTEIAWADADDPPASLVSYRLVLDLVRWSLRADGGAATLVQFRLTDDVDATELLVSEVHPL